MTSSTENGMILNWKQLNFKQSFREANDEQYSNIAMTIELREYYG